MDEINPRRSSAKSKDFKKPSLPTILLLSVALSNVVVPVVQANPFIIGFGVVSGIVTLIPWISSLTKDNFVPDKVVIASKAGYNYPGQDDGTQGPAPWLVAVDAKNRAVFRREGCQDSSKHHIKDGETKVYTTDVITNSKIDRIKMTAGDSCDTSGCFCLSKSEPTCIANTIILPPDSGSAGQPVYFSGTILAECGASWYHGRDSFSVLNQDCQQQTLPEKCVWMSNYRQGGVSVLKQAHMINVPTWIEENEGTFRPSCGINLNLQILEQKSKKRSLTSDFDYAMYNDIASAIELCTSDTSYGPSFLSLKESLYCDMATKTLIPMCNTEHAPVNNHTWIATSTCINSDGSFVTYQTSKNSQLSARDLTPIRVPLKFLGPPPGSVVQTPAVNNTLFKRQGCNVKRRSKISAGQRLWSGEQLTSSDGTKRYVAQSDGNSVIYDESGNVLWTLGQYIPSPRSTYYAELQRDGNFCFQAWNGDGKKCVRNFAFPDHKYEMELYGNGLLYFKETSGYVKATNLCPVWGTSIVSGTRMDLSCVISPNHNAFLYMQPDGNLVTYVAYKAAWAFPQAMGSGRFLELTNTGALRILDSGGNIKHTLFNGGLSKGTYYASVTNDGKISIKGTDGKEKWTKFPTN